MRTITLQDKASSPNTELRLIVDEEEGGIERWREYRAPKLPPRRTQGALTVSEQDPLVDFTWAQDDWSGGGLRPYYREGDAMISQKHCNIQNNKNYYTSHFYVQFIHIFYMKNMSCSD